MRKLKVFANTFILDSWCILSGLEKKITPGILRYVISDSEKTIKLLNWTLTFVKEAIGQEYDYSLWPVLRSFMFWPYYVVIFSLCIYKACEIWFVNLFFFSTTYVFQSFNFDHIRFFHPKFSFSLYQDFCKYILLFKAQVKYSYTIGDHSACQLPLGEASGKKGLAHRTHAHG